MGPSVPPAWLRAALAEGTPSHADSPNTRATAAPKARLMRGEPQTEDATNRSTTSLHAAFWPPLSFRNRRQ